MNVMVIRDAGGLEAHAEAWRGLAEASAEPNIFYEPWLLLPAVRAFGHDRLRFVLVFAEARATANNPLILVGLFPLELERGWNGLPVPTARMWRYVHCYLSSPLIRRGYEQECLAAFFGWLREQRREIGVMQFPKMLAHGPGSLALLQTLTQGRRVMATDDFQARALFRRADDAETYLRQGIAGKHRKDLRRRRARLEELGTVRVARLKDAADLPEWTARFLELERLGWKGQQGTALEMSETDRRFFADTVSGAFAAGRLHMLALLLNDRPIAMKCNFLSGDGGFAFKIAFDEAYAYYSPGLLLEIEHVHALHDEPGVEWMDSCAVPDHFMINRLWPDRRAVQSVIVANGGWWTELLVAALPMASLLRRRTRGARAQMAGAMRAGAAMPARAIGRVVGPIRRLLPGGVGALPRLRS